MAGLSEMLSNHFLFITANFTFILLKINEDACPGDNFM